MVKRQSDPNRLIQAARETIASYPVEASTIYTGGSVEMLEVIVRAGYGAVIPLSGNPESEELILFCRGKSSLEAESVAMFKALAWLYERVKNETAPIRVRVSYFH